MSYSLWRKSDNSGDSGQMSRIMRLNEDNELLTEENAEPRVGWSIRVGSHFGRTFSGQDWWQTTYITEIVSEEIKETGWGDKYKEIVFKTGNSEYIWREYLGIKDEQSDTSAD